MLSGYWLGVLWQAGRTLRSLGWLGHLPEPSQPAFSFGKYVFLSPAHTQLSPAEYAQLVQHEQVHCAQYHSLDLLLAEVIG